MCDVILKDGGYVFLPRVRWLLHIIEVQELTSGKYPWL